MRTVVLTGVSRGLGAALFDQLAHRGDRIFALGRRFSDEQEALAAAEPDRIRLRRADLAALQVPTDTELADALRGSTHAVLLHNAGVVEPVGAVGTLPPDGIASAVTLNLTAPMLLTNAFLAALPAAARATILFISSGAAKRVIGGWAVYSATKAGGEMFFEVLADQVGRDGRIAVASVNPGVMDTGMQAALRAAARDESVHFPDRERFLGLAERGELPPAAEVASKIIKEHLTSE